MSEARTLSRPPIIEALVDIRASVSGDVAAFQEFAKEFRDEFPKVKVKHGVRAELKVERGRLLPPSAEMLGFQGVALTNDDETLTVQFRPDGFTLNNVQRYIGGDRLISDAVRLWSRFADRMQPANASRVAFRYINQLNLPLQSGEDFDVYLTSAPELPKELPQHFSEFLSQIVAHNQSDTTLVVTQRLTTTEAGPILLLDIDVAKYRAFSGNADELSDTLATLRILRNQAF